MSEEIKKKKCTKCDEIKPIYEFYKYKYKNALSSACKECIKKASREYSAKNIDKAREYNKVWRIKNANVLAKKKKIYAENNKDKISAYQKNYREEHKEKAREYDRKYKRERIKIDINYALKIKLRTRLYQYLRLINVKKDFNTMHLIGCSIQEAREHLEKLFQPGMAWDNHGKKGWHIDHIKPCASFDLTDPEQQKACFHYTNLQPLWWYENLAKRSKDKSQINWKDSALKIIL